MNFAEVLTELEMVPVPTDITAWLAWAEEQQMALPDSYLKALQLGAAQLLSLHSNDEEFEAPAKHLLDKNLQGLPVLRLLSENQGNYFFGLHLNGEADPPVLLCHRSEYQNQRAFNLQWLPYTRNFADFAFARLFDYQFRWRAAQEGWSDDLPLALPPLDAELKQRILEHFRQGPTTPEVIALEPGGSRQRFYRPGQRLSFTLASLHAETEEPDWEAFAATPGKHAELVTLLKELMS